MSETSNTREHSAATGQRSDRTPRKLLFTVLLVAGAVAGIACVIVLLSGGFGAKKSSITDRLRKEAPPRVAQFLVEGQRALERGVYDYALAMTDSVEAIIPELADLHYLRGAVYTQMNRLEIAQAAYETVLELDPAYPGARFHMGLNNFRRGQLRDAIDNYLAEQEVAPTTGLFQELGRAYAKLGEPDSARQAYEAAVEQDSTNTTALMWLGQLLEETGDLEGALEASLRGLVLRPNDLDYQYIIGTQYFRLEQPENALPYLEPVADQWQWHHGAQFNLGQVYMRLGREEDAQRYFVRADSAQQMQQEINRAQEAINRDPETLDNWLRLGGLLRKSGQLDRAIEAYKNAVALVPWNLHLQNNLAILFMENGDMETAIQRYQAILRADPTMNGVWLNLGVAYANANRIDEARSAWEQVLARTPNHPTVRSYLARLDTMSISE